MRESIKPTFIKITEAWEGPATINWMFPDVLGLVSTGMGLLLDPVAMAVGLPWRRSDGSLADRDEIVADFYNVKNFPDAAKLGHRSVQHVAKLRVRPEDIHERVLAKAESNETILRQRFPEFDSWPSDAQLAIHSLAWGCGAHFRFPKLEAALKQKDFRMASTEVRMTANGVELYGLKPRNTANRIMLQNAAIALNTFDPKTLFYPTDLESSPVGSDDPTQPALGPVVDFPIVHPPVDMPDNEPPDDAA